MFFQILWIDNEIVLVKIFTFFSKNLIMCWLKYPYNLAELEKPTIFVFENPCIACFLLGKKGVEILYDKVYIIRDKKSQYTQSIIWIKIK